MTRPTCETCGLPIRREPDGSWDHYQPFSFGQALLNVAAFVIVALAIFVAVVICGALGVGLE